MIGAGIEGGGANRLPPSRKIPLFLCSQIKNQQRFESYVPTLEDFWTVFHFLNDDQDKLMLYCYLQTGARRDELFRLTWADVDFFRKRIRLSWRKTRSVNGALSG
jgi:integrase